MDIKQIDFHPQPGGFVRVSALVDGNIQDVAKACQIAEQRPCELVVRPKERKRTLTANAYYQVLLDKMSSALKLDRRELHRMMLASYGVTDTFDGVPIFISMKEWINPKELGDIYVDFWSKNGDDVTYRVLKHSSDMNSREFAALVEGVVSECKELGIETIPDKDLERLFKISQ